MKKLQTIKWLSIVAVLIVACAKKPERPVNTAPQYFTHTISSQGETLASIAKWYTGASSNWQAILAYNPGLDVRRMRIGTQVNIPNNMLIRTASMPKNKGGTATAKTQEVEIIQPAQDSLANVQTETTDSTKVTEEFPPATENSNETAPTENTITNPDGEEIVVKQLSPEEIAALQGNSAELNEVPALPEGETADTPQKKSILSKFQEAAMKAQEKSLNGAETKPNTDVPVNTNEQVKAAEDQAKAAQEAANAQIKAAQEQAAEAMADAQKKSAEAQENSAKTRDDLIKELTQDY